MVGHSSILKNKYNHLGKFIIFTHNWEQWANVYNVNLKM